MAESTTPLHQALAALRDHRERDIVATLANQPDARVELAPFDRGSAVRLRTPQGCVGVVLHGHLMRRAEGPHQQPHTVEWRLAGELIGLTASLAEAPSRTLVGISPGSLVVVTSPGLRALLTNHPVLGLQAFQLAYQDLAAMQQRQLMLAWGSSQARVAWFLLSLLDRLPGTQLGVVDFPFTQHDVADYLGLSLTQTHRALSVLRARRIAEVSRQRLQVHAISQLRALAAF